MSELTRLDGSVWGNMERHPYHRVAGDHPEAVCPKCRESMYDQTPMEFPLEPLSPRDAPDLIVDRCTSCYGFWLDHGELVRIVEIADQYDNLKRAARDLDAGLVNTERAAMSLVEAWPVLNEEIRGRMLRIARVRPRPRVERNSLRLSDYEQLPAELQEVVDAYYEMSNRERSNVLALLPEDLRPAPSAARRPGSPRPAQSSTLATRPADWSWVKWITHRFKRHLAENADDIF